MWRLISETIYDMDVIFGKPIFMLYVMTMSFFHFQFQDGF